MWSDFEPFFCFYLAFKLRTLRWNESWFATTIHVFAKVNHLFITSTFLLLIGNYLSLMEEISSKSYTTARGSASHWLPQFLVLLSQAITTTEDRASEGWYPI